MGSAGHPHHGAGLWGQPRTHDIALACGVSQGPTPRHCVVGSARDPQHCTGLWGRPGTHAMVPGYGAWLSSLSAPLWPSPQQPPSHPSRLFGKSSAHTQSRVTERRGYGLRNAPLGDFVVGHHSACTLPAWAVRWEACGSRAADPHSRPPVTHCKYLRI